jgi:hypothetical protein
LRKALSSFVDIDASNKIVRGATTTSSPTVDGECHPIWPVLVIALGLLSSLAWSVALVWTVCGAVGEW